MACTQAYLRWVRLCLPQASFTDEDLAHMYRQRCEWPCAGGVEWETQTARLALQVLADLRECEGDLEAHAKNQFLMLLRQALDAASLAQQVGRARRQEASEEVGMAPPYHSDGPPVDRSQEAPEDRIGAPPPLQRLRSVAGRRPTGPVAAWPSAEKEAESEPASPPAAAAAAAALCPGDRVRHTGSQRTAVVIEVLPSGIGANLTPQVVVKPGARQICRWPLHEVVRF